MQIPYILQAQSLRNGTLKLIASPWSAPAYMKTGNSIHGKGTLKPEYYQLWADYFVRLVKGNEITEALVTLLDSDRQSGTYTSALILKIRTIRYFLFLCTKDKECFLFFPEMFNRKYF